MVDSYQPRQLFFQLVWTPCPASDRLEAQRLPPQRLVSQRSTPTQTPDLKPIESVAPDSSPNSDARLAATPEERWQWFAICPAGLRSGSPSSFPAESASEKLACPSPFRTGSRRTRRGRLDDPRPVPAPAPATCIPPYPSLCLARFHSRVSVRCAPNWTAIESASPARSRESLTAHLW